MLKEEGKKATTQETQSAAASAARWPSVRVPGGIVIRHCTGHGKQGCTHAQCGLQVPTGWAGGHARSCPGAHARHAA